MVCFIVIVIMVGIIDWYDIIVRVSICLGFNCNVYVGNFGVKYWCVVFVICIDCC